MALFLVFSLLMLYVSLEAKERRGAKLIITKLNGRQMEGELITVKHNSLLLLNTEGEDESIDISDIKVIRVVKESTGERLALFGLSIGCVGGAVYGSLYQGFPGYRTLYVVGFSFTFGVLGMIVGGYAGKMTGKDKTIQIEGMTDLEIQETLDKLCKKVRFRDYK